jgi:hypothetical protein
MADKDILRIILFFLVALFAFRSSYRSRSSGSVRINNPKETEDTETQQLIQHVQDNRKMALQEPNGYETKKVSEKV